MSHSHAHERQAREERANRDDTQRHDAPSPDFFDASPMISSRKARDLRRCET